MPHIRNHGVYETWSVVANLAELISRCADGSNPRFLDLGGGPVDGWGRTICGARVSWTPRFH